MSEAWRTVERVIHKSDLKIESGQGKEHIEIEGPRNVRIVLGGVRGSMALVSVSVVVDGITRLDINCHEKIIPNVDIILDHEEWRAFPPKKFWHRFLGN